MWTTRLWYNEKDNSETNILNWNAIAHVNEGMTLYHNFSWKLKYSKRASASCLATFEPLVSFVATEPGMPRGIQVRAVYPKIRKGTTVSCKMKTKEISYLWNEKWNNNRFLIILDQK